MSLYSALTDLLRQVANVLQPAHGGTGSTYGEERVVVKAINSTGSNIRLYSAVEPTFGANDLRIEPVTTAGSTNVLGSLVGYYGGDGVLIEDDAPDGYEVAVQTAGVARFLIQSNVIRGERAFTTTGAGKIASSSTGSGAIGVVVDTAWLTQTSNTRVYFSALGSASAGGWDTIITKGTNESLTSNTTKQNDNEIFFSAVSGALYQFEAFILMASPVGSSSVDIKFSFGESNTFMGYMSALGGNVATGVTETIVGSVRQDTTVFAFQTGTTPFAIYCVGSWVSEGGTFRLMWAQNTSDTDELTVYAGSTLKVKRLA